MINDHFANIFKVKHVNEFNLLKIKTLVGFAVDRKNIMLRDSLCNFRSVNLHTCMSVIKHNIAIKFHEQLKHF